MMFRLAVDDGLIVSEDEQELPTFINELKKEFKITFKPAMDLLR